MFPNNGLNSDITILGMPLVQSLHDAIRIGAIGENLKNKNVCLMISMQWFTQEDGISRNEFKSHFSALQFYELLRNEKISENSKKYLCERVHCLLYEHSAQNPFTEEYLYAKLYKNTYLSKFIFPYYYLKNKFLLLKDKYNSLKIINRCGDLPEASGLKWIDWETEKQKAYEEGKLACTTNEFFYIRF